MSSTSNRPEWRRGSTGIGIAERLASFVAFLAIAGFVLFLVATVMGAQEERSLLSSVERFLAGEPSRVADRSIGADPHHRIITFVR